MRFPEWLYRLLQGDEGSQLLSVVWREVASTATVAALNATVYQVPGDKCLILTNAACRFIPGNTQTVNRRRLMADPPSGTTRYNILDEEVDGAASITLDANWQGEVIIPPGWRVLIEGTFNSAVNANTVEAEIHGYLVPRGTIVFA